MKKGRFESDPFLTPQDLPDPPPPESGDLDLLVELSNDQQIPFIPGPGPKS
jgi:hypothetical protein